jgi:hypothetical protein
LAKKNPSLVVLIADEIGAELVPEITGLKRV